MSARRLDDGRWIVNFTTAEGKRARRTVTNAEEALALVRGQRGAGELFADHAAAWLKAGEAEWRGGALGSTYRAYESITRIHLIPRYGPRPLQSITRREVAEFRAELLGKLTTKSAINVFSALSSLFRRAREWDLIADVPTSGHRPPRAELRAELGWWTVEQAAHALTVIKRGGRAFRPWALPFYTLALRTGLRLGELVALEWRDLVFSRGVVEVRRSVTNGLLGLPKNGRGRNVPIYADVDAVLRPLAQPSGLVHTHNGQRLTPSAVRRQHDRLCAEAGLPVIRIHDLWHSYASQLVLAGVPIAHVQKLMGHQELKTTMRYAHLAEDEVHKATRPIAERFWTAAAGNG